MNADFLKTISKVFFINVYLRPILKLSGGWLIFCRYYLHSEKLDREFFIKKDLTDIYIRQVFPLSYFFCYSTILIGSSFFPANAATLTLAAIFSAISFNAIATVDSGYAETMGLPVSPPMRTF